MMSIMLISLVSAVNTYSLNSVQDKTNLISNARIINITMKSSDVKIPNKIIYLPVSVYKYPWKSQAQINRELDDLTEARLSQLNITWTRTTERLNLDSLDLTLKGLLSTISNILERLFNAEAQLSCQKDCLAQSKTYDEYKICMGMCK